MSAVKVGSYDGNGSSQSIITGFQPVAVFIKGGSQVLQLCTDTMGVDKTKPLATGTALVTGSVTSLNVNGFSVGANAAVNENSTVFHYVALASGSSVVTGRYNGTGSAQTISGVGFTPAFLVIGADGGDFACFKMNGHATNGASRFDATLGSITNVVTAFTSDGFSLGTNNLSNGGAGRVYNYLAIQDALFSTPVNYTGDGNDDRNITGAGFKPDVVFLRNITSAQALQVRFSSQSGDSTFPATAASSSTNRVQSLINDGYQVGTDASVNTNTNNYISFCLIDNSQVNNRNNFFNFI